MSFPCARVMKTSGRSNRNGLGQSERRLAFSCWKAVGPSRRVLSWLRSPPVVLSQLVCPITLSVFSSHSPAWPRSTTEEDKSIGGSWGFLLVAVLDLQPRRPDHHYDGLAVTARSLKVKSWFDWDFAGWAESEEGNVLTYWMSEPPSRITG